MRVSLPEPDGTSGEWRVDTIEIPEGDAAREGIAPGPFRRLLRGTVCVMTNSERESAEHRDFAERATGRVLINGLGLGLAVVAALEKAEVESVFVVEASTDVIELVAPHFCDARLKVFHADAFAFEPDGRLDVVWHDIWDTSGPEHDAAMRALWAKYLGRCDWQGVWSRPEFKGEAS